MKVCKEDVYQVISDVLNIDTEFIRHMNEAEDLVVFGMDSVSVVQLVVNLEEKYEIEFQDEDMSIERLNTLNKLFSLLERYCL